VSASSEVVPAATAEGATGVNVYGGLLWREWLAHRSLVINTLAVWLVCGWVLLIFFHPGFIIALGAVYAMWAGARLGGADAAEGSEEFAFSLPPTRHERYILRMLFGGTTVVILAGLGTLTIALDLPQRLWALVVETGFTEPFPRCEERFLYGLTIALLLGVFGCSFAIATNASTRGLVGVSWILGALGAGAVVGLGFLAERLLWQELNGYVSITALLALTPLALLAGYLVYQRKEGISRPAPIHGRSLWWVWLILAGVVLLLLMILLWGGSRGVSDQEPPKPPEPTMERPAKREPVPAKADGKVEPDPVPSPDQGR